MKFLIDMPLSPQLAQWLIRQGHDAVHASAIGLAQSPDSIIMDRAREESRAIITADLDYPRLLALTAVDSPGLILFRGGDYSEEEVRVRLAEVLGTIPSESLARSIVVVEKSRIRRRNLPIQ